MAAVLAGAGVFVVKAPAAGLPASLPVPVGLLLLAAGVMVAALGSVWVMRHRGWPRFVPALLAGGIALVAGFAAISINAATTSPPAWPSWLAWLPVPPVTAVVLLIGLDVVLAAAVAPKRGVRRVWAMERPDEADLPRTALSDPIRAQLAEADGGTVGLTTGLVGAGGFGKTTLARLLCSDRRVRRLFRAGVWVTVGEDVKGADLAQKINDMSEQLTGSRPGYVDPDLAGQHLGQLLDRSGRVLLVIDDVWRAEQLRPFMHSGRRATRLVTTRRPDVLPPSARARGVRVDELEPAQARLILAAGLPPIGEPEMTRLLRLTGRWPLLLRLANGHLRDALDPRLGINVAAAQLADQLEQEGPDTLSLTDEASRQQAVAASINASLNLLIPAADDPVDCRVLYTQLAVFAEDSDIDIALLHALWGTGSGLSANQVDRLCRRLASLSLVADYQPGRSLRLHDVIRAHLRTISRDDLPALHASLLDAARGMLAAATGDEAGPTPWWLLPDHARYLWQHLFEHLHTAGHEDEVADLLRDLRWAEAKLRRDGPAALGGDFGRTSDPTVAILRQAISQNAHLLTPPPGSDQWWLADQLVDRLWGIPGLEPVLNNYLNILPQPLRDKPRSAANAYDPALRRTLTDGVSWFTSCAISPDGTWLATFSAMGGYGTAAIWDSATGALRHTLPGRTGPVHSCAIAPDGTWIAIGGYGATLLWDSITGALRNTLTDRNRLVSSCAIAPDGTWLATTGHRNSTARIWDSATGALRHKLRGHTAPVNRCVIAPDGTWLATASRDGTARIWDSATGALRHTLTGHIAPVMTCVIAPDGTWLATAGGDGTARIWDSTTGALRHTLTGHTGPLHVCAIAPAGTWLATASSDGTARIWDSATGLLNHELRGHTGPVPSCAIAPDGTWLATAGHDGTARIWDCATGALRRTLTGHTGAIRQCAIAPDGTWLLTNGGDQTARIWDAR
ncbi:NB-ARC domain-containing protein [Catellatospora tritici]|uniref:NB-ARC domain-containing protein n=1 Tax=Catellatospora tritici TaxID=2851566 RepID=UPI001C2DEFCE|nr:NB-ARC domain-containing protein [Catellatospora tritici]MBV1856326.1 hypothetical protein [Catellatospora tritici]